MLGFLFAKEVFSTVPRLPFTEKSQGFDEPQSGVGGGGQREQALQREKLLGAGVRGPRRQR